MVQCIVDAGFETGVVHAAGSDALMHYEFAKLDAVRVGTIFLIADNVDLGGAEF